MSELLDYSCLLFLIGRDLICLSKHLIVGLWNFKKFFLHVAVFHTLENDKVHAFVLFCLWNFLKDVLERNELHVTVASGDSENWSLEHQLFSFIDYSVVDPKYTLVVINLAEVTLLTGWRDCMIGKKVPDRVSRWMLNILYPAIMMAIFSR